MKKNRVYSPYFWLLIPLGVLINYLGVRLALSLSLPLYLDSIGTVFAAILGGYLPGIIVGFCSNIINGISDPITLYYGICSVLIAICAAFFVRRGVFQRFGRTLLAAFVFSLIGGGLGSVLTWLLYGFSFGAGISAPFAILLHEDFGFSQFFAQFSADMCIDLADKLLTVLLLFLVLRLLPRSFLLRFPCGEHYCAEPSTSKFYFRPLERKRFYRKQSLKSQVVTLIVATSVILGTLATTISFVVYRDTMTEEFISVCDGVTVLMDKVIEPETIDTFLAEKWNSTNYQLVERQLYAIKDSFSEIEYMYVYRIDEEGILVVFDLDSTDLPGEPKGTRLEFDPAFEPYREKLLAGEEIPVIISNDQYGWLLTVYRPILDSSGHCVAYAAADVAMDGIITDRLIYLIKLLSLLFGASVLIVVFAVWFAQRKLVEPINEMASAADAFAYVSEEDRERSVRNFRELQISTGNEIENLYRALDKTIQDESRYIAEIRTQTGIIAQMQQNVIFTFANMVENRDLCTGEHIRHTAAYVELIAREIQRENLPGLSINDTYLRQIVDSAPLHDIGKIKISDVILNKPGKLTAEEFAQMKTHTTAGREILEGAIKHISDSSYLSEAVNMAAYHHEWWDGTGYPDGKKEDEIPLSARIMAVADVFDALVSKRPYKEPLSPEQAKEIICKESGTHFDPRVVEAFCAVFDQVQRQLEN